MIGDRSQAEAVRVLDEAVDRLDESPLPQASLSLTRWWGDLDVETHRRRRDPRLVAHAATSEEWTSTVFSLDEELNDLTARWDVLRRDLKRFRERVGNAP